MDEIKIKTMDIELPTWDLSEIYENIDDPNIELDIKKIKELSEDFSIQWKGKIKDLNASEFLNCIETYQKLGCWTPHINITHSAFESTLDIFEYNNLIKTRHSYDSVCRSIL